ncbi:hypothetical protein QTO34_018486 [Cnephaeus nilssonii]|uniref:Reverse transcriptase/retrotransposon-derived protein RNase H-like domain-containing protein n=1 Tax=Cnephaeus nilssonii TaxID=3371016 RepID=A0AA40HYW8_CNENI|nr:hypothetical protein QTO34_018486 [Eptesicus nilssonii]
MFKQLDDKYTQLNENYKELNENVTNMKRNQEEMKNDMAAIKNTLEGLNSRLEEAKDCISELEDKFPGGHWGSLFSLDRADGTHNFLEDISPGSHRTNCLFSLDIKKDCGPRKEHECSYPLCRRDLLQKLFGRATITFEGDGAGIPRGSWILQPVDTGTEVEQRAFEELKKALVSAPALALPDVMKPFHLYVSEVRGIAKGVLTQTLGPWKRPVAYLSKRLDPVAAGWPACLWAVATTALLVKEADKLTLGQELALTIPHAVEALLRGAPERWMSNTRITSAKLFSWTSPVSGSIRHWPSTLPACFQMMIQRNPFMTAQR